MSQYKQLPCPSAEMKPTALSSLASYDLQPFKTAQVELSENLLALGVHSEDSGGLGTPTSGGSACSHLAHSLMGMVVATFGCLVKETLKLQYEKKTTRDWISLLRNDLIL